MDLWAVVMDATTTITTTTRAVTTTAVQTSTTFGDGSSGGGQGFWASFLPNFVATVLGAGLGVLGALWLDRTAQRRAEAQRQRERAARLREVARILVSSLRINANELRVIASLGAGKMLIFPHVEFGSWPALRDEAFDLIPSMELKRDLARHFEWVTRIVAATDHRTQRYAARLNQPIWGEDQATQFEQRSFELIKQHAAEEADEASRLADMLEEVEEQAAKRPRRSRKDYYNAWIAGELDQPDY
jgi:hypothetical protein